MSSIFNGQFNSKTSDEQINDYLGHQVNKNNYKNVYEPIDISKITRDIVPLKNGGTMKINPAEIADTVKLMFDEMQRDSKYDFIKPYIQKPVIWTYEISTAMTDGIRIYMSPAFAAVLLSSSPRSGLGGKEAEEWFNTLTFQEQRDPKNRAKKRAILTKYVRFTIIHEIYHIIYNHVRRGILKYGSTPTKQEHYTGNVAMDLEINRDIESTFPDLQGSTNTIGGIWYENENYFNKKKQPFTKDIWEDIWDDFMGRDLNFNISDPFENEGANPMKQNKKQQGPFADGWRKAVDAIKGKMIDPKTFDPSIMSNDEENKQFEDELNKILNNE